MKTQKSLTIIENSTWNEGTLVHFCGQEFPEWIVQYAKDVTPGAKKISEPQLASCLVLMRQKGMLPGVDAFINLRDGVPKVEPFMDWYRKSPMLTGEVEAIEGPEFLAPGDDDKWLPYWCHDGKPRAARFRVKRKGLEMGWTYAADRDYRRVPNAHNLGLAAERQAWRRAFPEVLGGLYGKEEVDGATTTKQETAVDPKIALASVVDVTPVSKQLNESVPVLTQEQFLEHLDKIKDKVPPPRRSGVLAKFGYKGILDVQPEHFNEILDTIETFAEEGVVE